jgi:thermitase
VRRLIASTVFVACLLAVPAAQAADTVELIVRRDAGLTPAERADVRADAGVTYERPVRLPDTEVVSVPAGDAAQALRTLRADPDVRDVTRNGEAKPAATAGADTEWANLWALDNVGQKMWLPDRSGWWYGGTADADMDVPEAWALAPLAGAGVTVAVVDSGATPGHPDLSGQLASGGWDYVHGDAGAIDNLGHGTHVTGTIVARNGNGAGITGVAPAAKALEYQVFADDDGDGETDGTGDWDWVIDAFDHAGAGGARVVNASLGGPGDAVLSNLLTSTVNRYPNTLFVVAAGNEHLDLEPAGTLYLPCETPAPNVLCVGASDTSDARATFSNYGDTAVDVFAPGTVIESTTLDGGYGYMQGTSMATPNTAGVAALLFAQRPAMTGAAVRQRLIDTADPVPGLPSVAEGRVNARAALAADGDPCAGGGCGGTPAPTPVTPPTAPSGGVINAPPLTLVGFKTSSRHGKLTVRVRTSEATTVRISAARRTCRRGTCTWRTKARRTLTATPTGAILLRLPAGRYRVRVSAGTAFARDKTVTVRR